MIVDLVGCEPTRDWYSGLGFRSSLKEMAAGYRALLLAGALIAGLAGCGFREDKEAAERAAEQLFEELSNGLTDAYFDLYSDEFYELTTRDEWQSIRRQLRDVLGAYRGHELADWSAEMSTGAGTTVTLVYRVTYTNMDAVETLVFRTSDGMQLFGHHLRAGE